MESEKVGIRLLMAHGLSGAVGGHYLSYLYHKTAPVPEGIGLGLVIHSALGAMAGGSLLLFLEPDHISVVGGTLAGSVLAGFGQGLYFFRDKYDSFERAGYNSLGAVGGGLFPLGLILLFDADWDADVTLTSMTAGAVGGYVLTRYLTRDLLEKPANLSLKSRNKMGTLAFGGIPAPEPYRHQREVRIRYKLPILHFSF